MIYEAAADIWFAFKEFNRQAIWFALIAMVIYSGIIIFHNMYRAIKGKPFLHTGKVLAKMCVFAIFGMYASYAVSLTLSGREAGSRSGVPSLVPGATLFIGNRLSIFSVENWLLFLPFGFLVPILWKYNRSVIRTGCLAFISSLIIETAQFLTGRGYFEVDDILLNTFGGICGYIIFACVYDSLLGIKRRILMDVSKKKKVSPPLGNFYKRYVVSHEWALIILQSLPVVFCIYIISNFSNDGAEASRAWSRPLAYALMKFIGLFKGSSSISAPVTSSADIMAIQSDYLDMIEKVIRKIAHLSEYALLAACVWGLIFTRTYIKRIFSYIAGIVVVGIVGMWDELNQSGIAGRYGSIVDVGIDLSGAVIIILVIMITVKSLLKYYDKKIT